MSEDRSTGLGALLAALAIGAAVGAAIALLTAPRSGRETRRRLADFAREAEERIRGDALDDVEG